MNKKQELAVKRMNRALKALEDADIYICGMDGDLLYATKYACENTENDSDYCEVARACQMGDDGTGTLDAVNYQDSGGW